MSLPFNLHRGNSTFHQRDPSLSSRDNPIPPSAAAGRTFSPLSRDRHSALFSSASPLPPEMLAEIAPKSGDDNIATPGQIIEFRCTGDDAWYPVRISLHGETLVVAYCDFPGEAEKERFSAGSFTTLKELATFRRRFRSISPQVQDDKCYEVRRGGRVCALCIHGDIRVFYDAIVDDVIRQVHTFTDEGEEECHCEFMLEWLHGPKAGTISLAMIENICHVLSQSNILDPRLTSFLTMSELRIPLSSSAAANTGTIEKFRYKYEEARHGLEITDDVDMGGGYLKAVICRNNNQQKIDDGVAVRHENLHDHHILIDNLEKDLIPSVVESFISEHISVNGKAYIFPSLLTETYTRGMIVVDAAENVEKVRSFLHQSDKMIVSSKGRPWVVPDQEKYSSCNFEAQSMVSMSQAHKEEVGDELKIFHSGTAEYKRAERRLKTKGEFEDHLVLLHERLRMDEKIISMSDESV